MSGEKDMSEKFFVSWEKIYEHEVGNDKCEEGWCDALPWGFPKTCVCGGLVHADFGDEDYDGDYWLYQKCDNCGDDWELV